MEEDKRSSDVVEKRRFLRFLVRYKSIIYSDRDIIPGTVLDVSEGGVGVFVPQRLQFHQEVFIKIKFKLGQAHKSHVQFRALVVWTEDCFINNMCACGLEIKEITHTDFDVYKALLEELYVRDCIHSKYERKKSVI